MNWVSELHSQFFNFSSCNFKFCFLIFNFFSKKLKIFKVPQAKFFSKECCLRLKGFPVQVNEDGNITIMIWISSNMLLVFTWNMSQLCKHILILHDKLWIFHQCLSFDTYQLLGFMPSQRWHNCLGTWQTWFWKFINIP